MLWRRELVVAAGASRVLRFTGRPKGRCPELVVAARGVQLTGGVERWQGRRLRWGLVEWRIRIGASRASRPGRRRLELWAHDPQGDRRSPAVAIDVRVVAGYEVVRRYDEGFVLRNRTDAPWRREEVWLAPAGALAPRVAMAEACVVPGGRATFTVPRALASRHLDLVHHRVARYRPPVC